MKKAMTPRHPRWNEFTERLEGVEGINYQPDSKEWKCHHDHRFSTAILETMPDIDIPKSLKYFNKNNGHCDCEILLNIGQ